MGTTYTKSQGGGGGVTFLGALFLAVALLVSRASDSPVPFEVLSFRNVFFFYECYDRGIPFFG